MPIQVNIFAGYNYVCVNLSFDSYSSIILFVIMFSGKAVVHAVRNFFSPEYGARRGHPRIIVAFVDGWPSDDIEDAAIMARESGINLFIVYVAKAIPEEMGLVKDQDFMKKV